MDTETTPTPAPATPAAAPKSLSGGIDPHVLNAHILAASKEDTRKSLKGINFKVRSGALHIASTDGRILIGKEQGNPMPLGLGEIARHAVAVP